MRDLMNRRRIGLAGLVAAMALAGTAWGKSDEKIVRLKLGPF
jgi:hypothetical protein